MENDDLILDPTPEPTVSPDATPEPEFDDLPEVLDPSDVSELPEESPLPETVIMSVGVEELESAVYNGVSQALYTQTVSDNQSVSSTALEFFKGILLKESPFTDYVIYVGEPYQYWWNNTQHTAYEYCMAYGALDLNGQTFTGNADIVTMRTVGENSVSFVNDQNISVTAPMYYSRSNLGQYSGVISQDYVSFGILCSLVLGGVVWFVKSLLSPKS